MKSLQFTFIICISTFIEFTSANVHEIGSADELETILKDRKNKLVVLEFFSTRCPDCEKIQPDFEALSEEMPDVVFLKVDVYKVRDVAAKYKITEKPTFIFFKKLYKRIAFLRNDLDLLRQLTELYSRRKN